LSARFLAVALPVLGLAACAPALRRPPASGAPAPAQRPPSAARPDAAPAETPPEAAAPARPPRYEGVQPPSERPAWMRSLVLPDVPLRWYPRVSRYLEQYRNEPRSREIIRGWLRRFGTYRVVMEEALAREGLPRGLVFVAMIESGFTASALSSRGAGGFWQFRPGVARAYGLEVSYWVDERRDLEKSTVAAAKYLSDLYHRFGTWELALAGYNAGPFAVLESIARFNTNDYGTLCRVESGLPWETTEYVPKVLAVGIVDRNRHVFGLEDTERERAGALPPWELAVVPPAISFETLAVRLGIKDTDLALLNPTYLRLRTPPDRGAMSLRVPVGTAERLSAGTLSGAAELATTVVNPGQTLPRLAKAHKVSAERLRRLNGVLDDSEVTPGTVLLVPRARPVRPVKAPPAPTGRRSPR
jgi:membrane-bound lytic murein transglycosylase D